MIYTVNTYTCDYESISSYILSIWPCKNICSIKVLIVIYFFPTRPIKLKLGLQIGGETGIATHLDQSIYLVDQ
jgi:hypothetical protein